MKLETLKMAYKSVTFIGNFPYNLCNWGFNPLYTHFLSYRLGSRMTRRFQGEFWEMWATVPWVQKHRAKENIFFG